MYISSVHILPLLGGYCMLGKRVSGEVIYLYLLVEKVHRVQHVYVFLHFHGHQLRLSSCKASHGHATKELRPRYVGFVGWFFCK